MIDYTALSKPFPPSAVSWRSQSLTKDGTKALALAYIDARDVMRRLDDVCGPAGWQDSYAETGKGRLICTISILCGDQWISKSDGAGDTAVEGEKGAISDAFKRCAVKWGVGRYLYDIDAVWAECVTYESNGRKHFKEWTARGQSQLSAALNKVVPHVAPRPDQLVTDEQLMRLQNTADDVGADLQAFRSEEHTSELQSLMRISYAVFCLNKKKRTPENTNNSRK